MTTNLEGSLVHPCREGVGLVGRDHREDPSYLEGALAFRDELFMRENVHEMQ